MNIPATAWGILALGLLWLALRWWQQKQALVRAEARELRMAELMAERERMAGGDEPAVAEGARVAKALKAPETAKAPEPPKEQRCLGCRTVNAGDATTCSGCGLEL